MRDLTPILIASAFALVFAGAAASFIYGAFTDVLTHRVDVSTYALAVFALIALLLGAAAAIEALNRLGVMP